MIGEKIKKKGLFKVSNELGVKPQRVSNWISRNSYPKKFLKPLAKSLNIELEKLIDEVVKEEK